MKIEVGKYYKSREGQKVGPMHNCLGKHPFTNGVDLWQANGMSYENRTPRSALIAEWIDEPVTGTLRELNVQVGDCVGLDGVEFDIAGVDLDSDEPFQLRRKDGWCVDWWEGSSDDWRIISRATQQPSPVITETVTMHRIVPGVYGRVKISDSITDSSDVCLQFVNGIAFSREELTAVIATLTQIRDALTHNSAK